MRSLRRRHDPVPAWLQVVAKIVQGAADRHDAGRSRPGRRVPLSAIAGLAGGGHCAGLADRSRRAVCETDPDRIVSRRLLRHLDRGTAPAVQPPRTLEQYVGVGTAYHSDQPFEFKRAYIDELHALAVPAITRPERYFLIAATGDEVLDWREMQAHYPGARQVIIEGSDHGLSDFEAHLYAVLAFCDAPAGA
jgi:hypothetical protein